MARLVAVWAAMCAGVILTVAAELMKVRDSLMNTCMSMGPSLTYVPVSYELPAASETLCAALCLTKGAQKYKRRGKFESIRATSFPLRLMHTAWAYGRYFI